MTEINNKTVKALKAECYDIEHEIEICQLREQNFRETLELKRDRIDRIQTGDNNE